MRHVGIDTSSCCFPSEIAQENWQAPDMERPVNYGQRFCFFRTWEAARVAVEGAVATIDHTDIRGSEPHNRDPSGAASDYKRGFGLRPTA